jgi:hypothetical protein
VRADRESDLVEQFAGAHDPGHPVCGLRKMPLVAGDDVVRERRFGAMQKLAVARIW